MQAVKDIEQAIEAAFEDAALILEKPDRGFWGLNGWEDFEETSEAKTLRIVGVDGLVYCVESYGGEGQGDERWLVLKVGDRHFRKNGWYASHYGSSWEGDFEEVNSRPVTREEWFRVS